MLLGEYLGMIELHLMLTFIEPFLTRVPGLAADVAAADKG